MTTKRKTHAMKITLRAYGNPDFRQYTDIAPKETVSVASLNEAVVVARRYIAHHNLGGGNWGTQSGRVFDGKQQIASVSYSGRLWDMGGNEIPQDGVKTVKQCEAEGWR